MFLWKQQVVYFMCKIIVSWCMIITREVNLAYTVKPMQHSNLPIA